MRLELTPSDEFVIHASTIFLEDGAVLEQWKGLYLYMSPGFANSIICESMPIRKWKWGL